MAKRKVRVKRKPKTSPSAKPAKDGRLGQLVDGYGKSVAAVLAGAISTIVIWVLKMKLAPDTVPAEIAGAIQTVITTGAVFFTPQLFRTS